MLIRRTACDNIKIVAIHMKKIAALSLAVIFLFSNISLYGSNIVSMDSLVKSAEENNPEILAAKKRWEASLARVPQMKSLDNPEVGLSYEKIPKGTLSFGKTEPIDRKLTISQTFPFIGKLSLKGKIAVAESQMRAGEYQNKRLEIISEVKNAYYDLFMNYKEIELNEESLKLLESILNISETKYISGEVAQQDLSKMNIEIKTLTNNIMNLKKEQSAKKTSINTLLNRTPELPLGDPELKEDLSFDKDIELLYKLTLENQPELAVFSYAIEKNRNEKALAKKSFLPDLTAQIGLRGITSGAIGPWDLMMALALPLWFWTKQRYEIKEAIANLDEAQAAYAAMKNNALSEVKGLATKVEVSKNKAGLYKNSSIPILENTIKSSLAAFTSGKGDLIGLMNNARLLLEAKMNYYKALTEYNMSLSNLERAVGAQLK